MARRVVLDDLNRHQLSVAELQKLVAHPSWRVRLQLAGDGHTPVEVLDALAHDTHSRVLLRLLHNPHLNPERLGTIAQHTNRLVRGVALRHLHLSPHVMIWFCQDPQFRGEASERLLLNAHSVAVARAIVASEDDSLKQRLAAVPSCPVEVQKVLADQSRRVRRILAARKDLSIDLRESLGSSSDRPTREIIASRPDLSSELGKRLLKDSSLAVRCAAAKTYGHRLRITTETPIAVVRAVASNPSTSPRKLAVMATKKFHWSVDVAISRNPKIRWTTAFRLLHDSRLPAVRVSAAETPRVASILKYSYRLFSKDPLKRFALAGNPATPQRILVQLARGKDPYVSGRTFGNPSMAPDLLNLKASAVETPAWIQRQLAANPAVPEATRDDLLTLLALGAHGPGDPHFDPVLGHGHPGPDLTIPSYEAYHLLGKAKRGSAHPLWRVRLSALDGTIDGPTQIQAAADPQVAVRQRLSMFTPLSGDTQKTLANDPELSASTSYGSHQAPKTFNRGLLKSKLRIGATSGMTAALAASAGIRFLLSLFGWN
jgi:hypothetical protein